jgi:hypothetical protein
MFVSLFLKGYTNKLNFSIFFRLQIVFNEFETKIQKVSAIVTRTYAEPNYVKKSKIHLFNNFTIYKHTYRALVLGFI